MAIGPLGWVLVAIAMAICITLEHAGHASDRPHVGVSIIRRPAVVGGRRLRRGFRLCESEFVFSLLCFFFQYSESKQSKARKIAVGVQEESDGVSCRRRGQPLDSMQFRSRCDV